MRRRTKWLLGGLGGALLAVGTGFQLMRLGYEEPAYEVVAEHGPLEVRRYAPRVVAQTVVSGAEGDVTGEGFRRRGWPALQLGARLGHGEGNRANDLVEEALRFAEYPRVERFVRSLEPIDQVPHR